MEKYNKVEAIVERKINSSLGDVFLMVRMNFKNDSLINAINGITSGLLEEISSILGKTISGTESTSIAIKVRNNPTYNDKLNQFLNNRTEKNYAELIKFFANRYIEFED